MASEYITIAEIYSLGGLPRGGLSNPARLIADVSDATEILTLDDHGLADDEPVMFRAEAGGSLPAPLVGGVTYYAIPLSGSTFSVTGSPGGAAINLSSTGENVLLITEIPYLAAIQWASALIDDRLIGHVVPMVEPYPVTVRTVAAQLAAAFLRDRCGQAQSTLLDAAVGPIKTLEGWVKGIKVRGPNVSAPANKAAVAIATATDPHGWNHSSGSGYIP